MYMGWDIPEAWHTGHEYESRRKFSSFFIPSSNPPPPPLKFKPPHRMDINSSSTEILEYISAFVDHPGDLLALALTCHTFADIIIPNHLEYSYIRIDVHRFDIWFYLIENPHLSARIHTLEIVGRVGISPSYQVIPRALWVPREHGWHADTMPTFPLLMALTKMPNLKIFRWLSLMKSDFTLDIVAGKCRQLSALEVICKYPRQDRFLIEKWRNFSNLRQFSYFGESFEWNTPRVDLNFYHDLSSTFQQLIHHQCPYLEDLQLDFTADTGANRFMRLLAPANLPNLRRLNVQAAILYCLDSILGKVIYIPPFPNLETLRLTKAPGYGPVYGALPKLRSLEMDDINHFPSPIAQNLTSLSLTIPAPYSNSDDESLFIRLGGILYECTNLRRLAIGSYVSFGEPLYYILKACPARLERLAYDGPPFSIDTPKLAKMETKMRNLTHLGAINVQESQDHFIRPIGIGREDHLSLLGFVNLRRFLLASAPMLKFMIWRHSNGIPRWEKVERDEAGAFRGIRMLDEKSYQNDIVYENWGGQYRGSSRVLVTI